MSVYFIFLFVLLAVYLISDRATLDKKKRDRFFCIFFFAGVFLLLALRHPSMGIDLGYNRWYGYLVSFEKLSAMSFGEIFSLEGWQNYERGYIIFNKLVGVFSHNRQFFLAVCAAISLIPVCILICRSSKDPVLSSFIYLGLPVFTLLYSGLRQDIAIGLIIGALYAIQKKKPFPFLLLVLLASCFHKSALIFLVAYPLYYRRINRAVRAATLAILPICYVLRMPLMELLVKLLGRKEDPVDTGALFLFVFFVVLYVLLFLLSDGSEEENGLLNLFFLACIIQAFAGVYSTAMRLGYYFTFPLLLLLPSVFAKEKSEGTRRILRIGGIIAFGAIGLYFLATTDWAMANPYYFFWQTIPT